MFTVYTMFLKKNLHDQKQVVCLKYIVLTVRVTMTATSHRKKGEDKAKSSYHQLLSHNLILHKVIVLRLWWNVQMILTVLTVRLIAI